MKNKILALIGAASILAAPNVFADWITLSQGPGGANGGGVFNATTGLLGSFPTFCLEDNEFISLGSTYTYVQNSGAVYGGYGTSPGGTATFDPLSIGTCYLYSQFRAGNTFGFGWTAAQLGNAMQNVIWNLEDEGAVGVLTTDGGNLLSWLSTATGMGYAQLITSAAPGAYGVVALNLTDSNGGRAQDQLGLVPEPSTVIAGALLLLPLGVSALRIIRKNRMA